jgi:hypothetical protein
VASYRLDTRLWLPTTELLLGICVASYILHPSFYIFHIVLSGFSPSLTSTHIRIQKNVTGITTATHSLAYDKRFNCEDLFLEPLCHTVLKAYPQCSIPSGVKQVSVDVASSAADIGALATAEVAAEAEAETEASAESVAEAST